MCGIAGIVTRAALPPGAVRESMLEIQRHRGPDGQGEWVRGSSAPGPHVWLGHRRLAIIDLSSAAAQPMASEDGSLRITYNGEIYNYRELMGELENLGHTFRTRSDTEVLLRAYAQWGESCLDRLNGMFAFAIWDERKRTLFAARDRFGEKPFHYIWDASRGTFAFASEIKALLALRPSERTLDDRALSRFITSQQLAGLDQTLWRGVARLPRAHWLRVSWRGERLELERRRYWDIDLETVNEASVDFAARRFAELFADSVRLRLRSDVPVGTSLSGGLDSSAVVCQIHALREAGGQQTFSARMPDPRLDEGSHIRAVLDKTGVHGHEVWPSAEALVAAFPKLCYHLEEPFLSTSQFAQFLVMELASAHGVTVLLDGQGADEMLAGYPPYFIARYGDLAARWQLAPLLIEWMGFRAKHHRPFPLSAKALFARLFPAAWRGMRSLGPEAAPAAGWTEMRRWWNPDWLAASIDADEPDARPRCRDPLTRKLYADTLDGELQELLRYGDRNSMAWSRELRQPFLDHRLVEFAFTLPPEHKLLRGETKVVMRRAMQPLLPESITRRQDKLGYRPPLETWLEGPLARWTERGLEQAEATLGARLAPGAVDRFRALPRPLSAGDAYAVFALQTLVESGRQLQAIGQDATQPAACLS